MCLSVAGGRFGRAAVPGNALPLEGARFRRGSRAGCGGQCQILLLLRRAPKLLHDRVSAYPAEELREQVSRCSSWCILLSERHI